MCVRYVFAVSVFFFFNDTATTEIYTLSLHDALPISGGNSGFAAGRAARGTAAAGGALVSGADRKSTRLNSSHSQISYAVFCLKKKKTLGWVSVVTMHLAVSFSVAIAWIERGSRAELS